MSKAMNAWRLAVLVTAAVFGLEILLRLLGVPLPGWLLGLSFGVLAFVSLMPSFGGRMHEPEGSPLKKAPWRF